ncbi:MAG TPA: hypothetical protein VIU33_08985, partial [Nitrospiria bacterium]
TGGSLYYLSHDRIIEGSEQVRIEVRDKDTGVILSSTTQEQNIDYQIKYEEGRLFFQRPIPSVSDDLTDLLDRDILEGNPVFVVVDFEYESGFFEDNVNGGHVRQQIGDHLAFGGTVVREEEGGEEYELGAGDIEVRVGEGTRILGEYARSRGAGSDVEFSPDGGLTFTPVDPGVSPEGRAYKTSIEADLGELFGKPNRFLLNGYLKELGRGYSSNGSVLEEGTRKAGVGTTIRAGEFDTFNLRYEGQRLLNNGNFLSQSQVGGRASYMETFQWIHDKGKLRLTGEYQARQLHSSPEDIRSQAAAARIDYRITGDLIVHFEQQSTLQGPAKNKTTVGARYSIGRYRLFGEGSTGTMGEGLRAGLSTEVGETGLISVSQLITRDAENGRSSQTILHGENRVGTGTRVYSEYQLNRSDKTDSDVSLMGITQRWEVSEGWVLNFLSEVTRLDQDGDLISRATAGAGLNLEMAEQLRLNDYLEVRYDKGTEKKVQYLTRNNLEYWLGRDFRLLGKINAGLTRNRTLDNTEARSTELSAGVAYRPVLEDRLNGILKYTLIRDQRPVQTIGDIEEDIQMEVWSAMGSYDLTNRLELVEKLAFKTKEERIGAGSTIKTHTTLSINRLNFHVINQWDLGFEYRILTVREARDRQDGYLLEITKEISKHLRLGGGYNFTDFSDNEFSDNDYSVQGWFFRFQGKY